MSLFRPRKTLHVHFPTFLLSAFCRTEGCCLRLQDLCFSSPRPMLFARKTYGFGLQERFPTGARAMVLGTESGFRRGQEPGGKGLPCCLLQLGLTKIFQPVWLT
jgi:hypothetical protein